VSTDDLKGTAVLCPYLCTSYLIWVQRDDTEDAVTYELVGAGIPKEKIVLGFHPQNVRQHTGYAIL